MNTILIIDDDRHIRLMLRKTLERAGYNTLCAKSGMEGIKAVRESGVDLIITDIVMPEMDGLETITEIRKMSPGIPVFAISGGGRILPASYLAFARAFGAEAIFEKPVDRSLLLSKIEEALT